MRITSRFSTAAQGGFMSIPMMAHELSYYYPDGKFDVARFREELSDHKSFTLSDDDNNSVYMFAIEFLDRVKIMVERHVKDNDGGVSLVDKTAPKTSAMRRFDKGRYTFVRVDIRFRTGDGSFRVKIDAANPKNVVGSAEEFACIMAQAYADNLLEIRDEFAKENIKVELIEGENCEGIFAKAMERNNRLRIRDTYSSCMNRIDDHCSPCKFNCELFANGKCRYAEIVNKGKE